MNGKIIDCITFFDNNYIFEIRYNILAKYVDYFLICDFKFTPRGAADPRRPRSTVGAPAAGESRWARCYQSLVTSMWAHLPQPSLTPVRST